MKKYKIEVLRSGDVHVYEGTEQYSQRDRESWIEWKKLNCRFFTEQEAKDWIDKQLLPEVVKSYEYPETKFIPNKGF